MNSLFRLFLLLTAFSFIFISCDISITDAEDIAEEITTEISTLPAQGSTSSDGVFTVASTLVEATELFGDDGYYFHMYIEPETCSASFYNGEIDFFVDSDVPLEPGEYGGDGPFIESSSFFGCNVIITSVSATEISGRVKGGNPDSDKWVEGSFTASLCQ